MAEAAIVSSGSFRQTIRDEAQGAPRPVGDFAKIGAASVVTTRDVPDGCTAVGNPARLTNCPEEAA